MVRHVIAFCPVNIACRDSTNATRSHIINNIVLRDSGQGPNEPAEYYVYYNQMSRYKTDITGHGKCGFMVTSRAPCMHNTDHFAAFA